MLVSDSVLIEHCFVHLSLLFLKLGGSEWIFGFVCSQTLFMYSVQPLLMFIPRLFCLRTTYVLLSFSFLLLVPNPEKLVPVVCCSH